MWLALGLFLLLKRNKTRSRGLPCLRRSLLFHGANHISFGRPYFPLEFQLSTGSLPPRPAARWIFGGSLHSCCGVWALSDTFWLGLVCFAFRTSVGGTFPLGLWLLSLKVFLSGFFRPVPSLLLAWFFSRVVFSAAMGHGEFPHSVFSLGWMRVSAISLSFLWMAFPSLGHLPGRGLPGC